ncbi:MAG: hypothetical protein M5U34_10480 [Chloroflexi bacterium]|nr:hypothetical protein [Chloroflexota bacterium]
MIYQVLGSQETIAAYTGVKPRYLCYPGGRYNEETMQAPGRTGLWGAVTTQGGTWHGFENRYEWDRQRMRYDTTLAEFARLIDPEGAVGGKLISEN